MAIQVSGVHKSYGSRSRKVEVLRNFNMTIPKGYIYGLLGKIQSKTYVCDIFYEGYQKIRRFRFFSHLSLLL